MNLHAIIYMGLALAYFEAALHSWTERDLHCACREVLIGLLYASIAFFVFDPLYLVVPPASLHVA